MEVYRIKLWGEWYHGHYQLFLRCWKVFDF